ncbi:tetratricopeptide repeat protein [Streptomyces sp. CHD11]|uniref:tetratricopeptide repeat protein n=1 Tax=Streptomyces sp. CHD11 TaxID=2741325 RepID=UPI001BFC87D2|nr:tetratricopeptide repeat protein [Streptomyces sp. CHD11]MBT3150817.1 tetratricopeptide repeat protein [Streptomyces sp. CHD11]
MTTGTRTEDPAGDDLAGLFDTGVAAALRTAFDGRLRQPSTRWQRQGYSGAVLARVLHTRQDDGDDYLIVKVLPASEEAAETDRHDRARASAPDFADRHMVLQPFPPLDLADGRRVMFQSVEEDLSNTDTLEKIRTADLPAACAALVRLLLVDWNGADRRQVLRRPAPTVAEYLRDEVHNALSPGRTAYRWADSRRLLSPGEDWVAMPDEPEPRLLPNPATALRPESVLGSAMVDCLTGHAHGDLHQGNVLVPLRGRLARADGSPAIRLIDLSHYAPDAPLSRDVVALVLSLCGDHLSSVEHGTRRGEAAENLIDLVLDPWREEPSGLLPQSLDASVRAIHRTCHDTLPPSHRESWHRQYLLSVLACAMVHLSYVRHGEWGRWWFFRLAARAAHAALTALRPDASLPAGPRRSPLICRFDPHPTRPGEPAAAAPRPIHWIATNGYGLLTAPGGLVGRQRETEVVRTFVAGSGPDTPRALVVRAVGGMGKSAMMWSFLQTGLTDVQRREHSAFDVGVWWSFSDLGGEAGALVGSLAALAGPSSPAGTETDLSRALSVLRTRRCLLVLDALERQLPVYQHGDGRGRPSGPPAEADGEDTGSGSGPGDGGIGLGVVDERLAALIEGVLAGGDSRLLVTTRLVPPQLEESRQVAHLDLGPLDTEESDLLSRRFGVSGDPVLATEIKRLTGGHPLLMQIVCRALGSRLVAPGELATAVARSGIPEQVTDEVAVASAAVLEMVVTALSDRERRTARVAASAADAWTTAEVHAMLRRLGDRAERADTTERTLSRLAGLGLMGRLTDGEGAVRWSMHPVVKAALAREGDGGAVALAVLSELRAKGEDVVPSRVRGLGDLRGPLEVFHALCDRADADPALTAAYDEAASYYLRTLHSPLTFAIREHQERMTLLNRLWPHGMRGDSPLRVPQIRAGVHNAAALTYQWLGHNTRAAELLREALRTPGRGADPGAWSNLASVLLYTDALEEACEAAVAAVRHALANSADTSVPLTYLALVLAQSGRSVKEVVRLRERLGSAYPTQEWLALRDGELALWAGEPERALRLGERSLALAGARRSGYAAPLIEATRLTGQCLVEIGRPGDALPLLEQALGRTRQFVLVQEELPIRIALARACAVSEPQRALRVLADGFDHRGEGEYRWFAAEAHAARGDILRGLGRTETGERHRARALALASRPAGWEYVPLLRRLSPSLTPGGEPPLPEPVSALLGEWS